MCVRGAVLAVLLFSVGAVAGASDLTLHLNGEGTFQRKTVKYQCDANGVKAWLPAGVFGVEYVNGTNNQLAWCW